MRYSQQDKIDNVQEFFKLLLGLPIVAAILEVISLQILYFKYNFPIFNYLDITEIAVSFLHHLFVPLAAIYIFKQVLNRKLRKPLKPYELIRDGVLIKLYTFTFACVFFAFLLKSNFDNYLGAFFFASSVLLFFVLLSFSNHVLFMIRSNSPRKFKNLYAFFGLFLWFNLLFQFIYISEKTLTVNDFDYIGSSIKTSSDTIKIDSTTSILLLTKNFYILKNLRTRGVIILPKEEVKSFVIAESKRHRAF